MNHNEFISISSEVRQLEEIITALPPENVIELAGFNYRLKLAKEKLASVQESRLAFRAKLTFKGTPVFGSHGINADFASKATAMFTDAVSMIAAAIDGNLEYSGPIPDKQKNQLLITGIALGSFGFELEVPQNKSSQTNPFPNSTENTLETAVSKMQSIFRLSANGTDDDIAEIIEEIHPRAIRKTAEFLDLIKESNAICGLEFKKEYFVFRDIEQLNSSAERLKEENFREAEKTYVGEFQGILPQSRAFEFKETGERGILKGKISYEIPDADILNRDFLHKAVSVKFKTIQVGQSRPKFTLESLENLKALI